MSDVRVPTVSGSAALPERRDPSAATVPLRWFTPGLSQRPDWDAAQAFRNAYLSSVWVWRCVNAIANSVAGLPFRAGLDPEKPSDHNPDARLAQLLGPPPHGPAPQISARRLWSWIICQYLVTGRVGLEIETTKFSPGEILALWPVPSSIIRPVPSKGGPRYFDGYDVGPEGEPEKVKRFTPDRFFYHWRPSGLDVRQPESVIQAAGLDISVAVMLDRYSYSFLKHDSRPASVMVTQRFPDQDDLDAFKRQFIAEYGGPENAGKMAFLEVEGDEPAAAAIDIKSMGLSQKDSMAVETYQEKIRAITVAFGVPLSILGDASGRTFDNAAQERTTYWQNTLLPLIRDLEDAVNTQLAPRLGGEVGWFDLTGVAELQPPRRLDSTSAALLVDRRIVTLNEARAELGFPPVPGGEKLEPLPALPDPQRSTTVIEVRSPAPADSRDARARLWRSIDTQARTLEGVWTRALQALFQRQADAVRKAITRSRSKHVRAASEAGEVRAELGVFDPSFWRVETAKVAEGLYEQTTAMGVARLSDKFGISFDLEKPWARDYILDRTSQLSGFVTDTTYAQVQQALADGVAAGESIADIAARVDGVFAEATKERAVVIARTEVISASNGATHYAAQGLPADVVGGKEWIATADGRTRESHLLADGQKVTMEATFDIDGSGLRYPGDPAGDPAETINCRCALAIVTPQEMPK